MRLSHHCSDIYNTPTLSDLGRNVEEIIGLFEKGCRRVLSFYVQGSQFFLEFIFVIGYNKPQIAYPNGRVVLKAHRPSG